MTSGNPARAGAAQAALALALAAVALISGCAIGERSSVTPEANDANTDPAPASNPAIVPPPSTTPRPGDMPLTIEAVVAFLDGCARTAESVSRCHCAIERLEAGFTMDDLEVFEDRMTGGLEYAPQVAGALVDCREDTAPRRWSDAARSRYVEACTKGSDRLGDLCACSASRAQDVVPERHLDSFISSAAVRPGFAELIGTCL